MFFSREPAPVEVLNDLNSDVVNLFRCLQDRTTFEELRHRIMWTPYARGEFARALEVLRQADADPVTRAWAFFVKHNQGYSGNISCVGNWARAFITKGGMSDVTNKWLMRQSMLDAFRARLMCVQIDNRDALDVIRYWDTEDTVFYIDPPYAADTRKTPDVYAYEPNDAHHKQLVSILLATKGAVVLSGYETPLYAPLTDAGWTKTEFATGCYTTGRTRLAKERGAGSVMKNAPRAEVVWRNPRCLEMLSRRGF